MAPSICGSFLTDKRSLIAFTWTITTVLTLVAFISALVMMIQVHTHYRRLEHYYEQQYQYAQQQYYYQQQNQQQQEQHGEQQQQQQQQGQSSEDKRIQQYLSLAQMSSSSMTFVAVYTMLMAMTLNMYGSTAIVGFTSLRGVYIGPCFSSPGSTRLKLGVFGGAIVFFANILLVCAVIFGEVRVEDWSDGHDRDDMEPYEVERIATVLAVTCMFLSALYTIFAIVLFLYFGSDDPVLTEHDVVSSNKPLRSITHDPRREKFITMGEAA